MIAALSHESFSCIRSVSKVIPSLFYIWSTTARNASCSFSTGIPNMEDNLAATFRFFEVSPSNKSHIMHRCITRDHMSFLSGFIRYMIWNLHGNEVLSSCDQTFFSPVYTTPKKFEDTAPFLQLGLLSTLIQRNCPLEMKLLKNSLSTGGNAGFVF